jgi:hypothetical protein
MTQSQRKSSFAKFAGWAWKLLAGVLVVAGGISTATSKNFRHAIRDAAEWLYPFWLVILLVVVALALLVALLLSLRLLRREQSALSVVSSAQSKANARLTELDERSAPGRAEHDVGVLRTIRQTLPRTDIDYWRDVDFGGIWHGQKTHHLMQMLYDHNAVEDRFLDRELEGLRTELINAVDDLMGKCAQYGVAHKTVKEAYALADAEWRRDNPPQGERYDRFEARREELGNAADELVGKYDALMVAAKQKLPVAFSPSGRASV